MAIGSHGTGHGGTVGDVRTGRSAEIGKALSFSSVFVRAAAAIDQPCVSDSADAQRWVSHRPVLVLAIAT